MAQWTTTPEAGNVRILRRAIREYALNEGLDEARAHDLTLAVSEIVSNAVLHAYRDGKTGGKITVGAEATDDDRLVVRVVDDGMGISPRPDSPGAGMGLMIAGTLAERLQIERPPHGGTEICMTFPAAA